MDRLHARYPFLDAAREAVEAADVDLGEIVASGDRAVIERGRTRVETALSEGHVGEPHRSTRVELLSYPVARVLVSLLEEPMAVDAYARAEAATARERLTADLPEPGSDPAIGDASVTVDGLLAEFGLGGEISGRDPFRIDVTTFLRLTGDRPEDDWALVDRSVADGTVPVDRAELYDLLEQAVVDRVTDGLPLAVPDAVAEHLAEQRDALEDLVTDEAVPLEFDAVLPDAFPPCVEALLERARAGESLPPNSEYALVGFLAATGMDADAVVDLAGGSLDRETVDHQLDHVRSDGALEYTPPSCPTMDEYGDCVNRDERCDTVNHPLAYYDGALEAARTVGDEQSAGEGQPVDGDGPVQDEEPAQ